MFLAALIMIVSTGLSFFYLQIVCQKLLRRLLIRNPPRRW
jgi:hypothetical protein